MKFIIMSIALMMSVNFSATAQVTTTANDSIKLVIDQLFTAMKNADSALLRSCFSENAVMQTIGSDKQGNTRVINQGVNDFILFVGKETKGAADERVEINTILSDGGLATVWTPYEFYYKGNFSHCGVNSFQLVRINGNWKIQYIIDTRRKTGCRDQK